MSKYTERYINISVIKKKYFYYWYVLTMSAVVAEGKATRRYHALRDARAAKAEYINKIID